MKTILKILLLSFLNSLVACGQQTYEQKLASLYKNSVPIIQAARFDSLKQRQEVRILDTRTAAEYNVSHIKGADFIEYDKFNINEFNQADKEKPIVIYCSVGYRSERIGEALLEKGYKNIYNLYGGIFQWKNEGFPVYDSEGEVTDKVHAYNWLWGKWLDEDKATKVYDKK